MNFQLLVNSIQQTHNALQQSAVKAINKHLTFRNWLIGFFIVEYEQKGADRADYGDKVLEKLAIELKIKGLSYRSLNIFRQFYLTYPQILQTLSAEFNSNRIPILQTSAELQSVDSKLLEIRQTVSDQFKSDLQVPPEKLINNLSFSHLTELLQVHDSLKRTFYEIECIKGNWSVRELRRQINSLYFERSGISKNPEKLSALVAENADQIRAADVVKSVYTFEFLGLSAKEVVEESDLETALLDHLQQFMLELGHGFCLEARQKRITIGGEYFFIDIVFYHRILKCHVLIELKVDEFNHVNAGQLNTYLNYYKKEVARQDDNPPVGILLVTNKNDALVEYATAGMDKHLFVSRYMVELPAKAELENFIKQELKRL